MDPEKRREVELIRQRMGVEERKARQWHQQYLENAMVLKELKDVGEDGSIYKMMGGVLVKQEHVEAVSNVLSKPPVICVKAVASVLSKPPML